MNRNTCQESSCVSRVSTPWTIHGRGAVETIEISQQKFSSVAECSKAHALPRLPRCYQHSQLFQSRKKKMFTAKRMIVSTKRLAALAASRLSLPSAASPDVAARRAEAPRLDIDERQLQQFTNTDFTIINTTTFAAAASARSAVINEPAIRRFKVLTAAELASKKLASSSYVQPLVDLPACRANKRSNYTSSIGSLVCHPKGSSRSVQSCLLDVSKKARYHQGLKCMLRRRLKGKLFETGQRYERNMSRSVHWNPVERSTVAHWNKLDRQYRNSYTFSLKELRSQANAEKEADLIVEIATNLECLKEDLSDHLRVRLEPEPNHCAYYKYLSEFLTLEDAQQFNQDCLEDQAQRIIKAAWTKRASRIQDLQVQVIHIEENVEFDSAVEPIVAPTVGPRWKTDLDSSLGKYWELPERTTRRARKQTRFFSPC